MSIKLDRFNLIPKGISLVLIVLSCFFVARITWQVVSFFTDSPSSSDISLNDGPSNDLLNQGKASRQNLSRQNGSRSGIQKATEIANVGLFGISKAEPQIHQKNLESLPQTKLSLELTGLLVSSEKSSSLAVIKYQNKQRSFAIGDKIENTKAQIIDITVDGVMIDEAGEQTILKYPYSIAESEQKATNNTQNQTSSTSLSEQETVPIELKETLMGSPQKIFDYLAISPVKEEDKLIGYRINPGKDPSMFESLGFISGDIATEINGIDLLDEQQALALIQELPTMTQLSINVEREGQVYTINLSLEE